METYNSKYTHMVELIRRSDFYANSSQTEQIEIEKYFSSKDFQNLVISSIIAERVGQIFNQFSSNLEKYLISGFEKMAKIPKK